MKKSELLPWYFPIKKVDAKGDGSDMKQLKAYNADSAYLELAPLRAEGVHHNQLFVGKLIAF